MFWIYVADQKGEERSLHYHFATITSIGLLAPPVVWAVNCLRRGSQPAPAAVLDGTSVVSEQQLTSAASSVVTPLPNRVTHSLPLLSSETERSPTLHQARSGPRTGRPHAASETFHRSHTEP